MTFEEWYDQEMQTSAFMREFNPAREFAKGVWQAAHAEGRRAQRERDAVIANNRAIAIEQIVADDFRQELSFDRRNQLDAACVELRRVAAWIRNQHNPGGGTAEDDSERG